MLSYIDCRIGKLKAFAKDGIERHPCILGGDLESLLDDVGWKPGKTRMKGIIITWCLQYLAWSMVTWTSICVRVCIRTADIMMSISPEDTKVSSLLNIHVSVIVLVGVSINKRFIPWSVKEYIVLMNKNSTSRCIRIGSKIKLVYNTVMVVPTKVKIGVQQRRIILLFIPCGVITLFVIHMCSMSMYGRPRLILMGMLKPSKVTSRCLPLTGADLSSTLTPFHSNWGEEWME
jgi:hypothetical protein